MKQKMIVCIVVLAGILVGCASTHTTGEEQQYESTGFVKAEKGNYDSADTAIVVRTQVTSGLITLRNIEVGKNYTLEYNMDTTITNQYGELISMNQISVGEIVDVTFMKQQKWLNTIMISPTAWTYTNVSNWEMSEDYSSVQVGKDLYQLYSEVVVAGEERQKALLDLHEMDVVTLKGIGQTIYTMTVENGHGYLRLEGSDYFVGGWIEVGKEIICPISENMMLTVPEGTHTVQVSKNGVGGTKQITVGQGEELKLDLSDIQGEETRIGSLVLSVYPTNATVLIDGEEVDTSEVLQCGYGVHLLTIRADGYQTIQQYLNVGQEYATIAIEMDLLTTESTSDNELNEDDVITPSLEGYVVRIEGPAGAEVYVDGAYMGIAPVEFAKVEGERSIILKKDGYETRTYTIQIDGEEKDIAFAFSELTVSY